MRILGGKWKGSILWHQKDGPVRFNDLARQLEAHRLVRREVLSTRPIAVAYEIMDFGRSALGVLKQLKDWTEEHSI